MIRARGTTLSHDEIIALFMNKMEVNTIEFSAAEVYKVLRRRQEVLTYEAMEGHLGYILGRHEDSSEPLDMGRATVVDVEPEQEQPTIQVLLKDHR